MKRPKHSADAEYLDSIAAYRWGDGYRIRRDGGIVDAPGIYLMGMPFLRRRKSAFIDGAAADARDLSDHLASYLAG